MDAALRAQRNEITEYYLYLELSKRANGKNRSTLERIAHDELRHYNFWKNETGRDIEPNRLLMRWYLVLATLLGLTFALRLRESGEAGAQAAYRRMRRASRLMRDEQQHEQELIAMLKDERLEYAGAIVLGLNDGLVELTGVLAGLTFALSDPKLIAVAGLVTGIAAAMSMAASGYFSSREEGRNPLRSALYTGIAYIIVVILLVAPYLLVPNPHVALPITLAAAITIIAAYSFFISVARGQPFSRRFFEMALISLTVAAISFGVGIALNKMFGISA